MYSWCYYPREVRGRTYSSIQWLLEVGPWGGLLPHVFKNNPHTYEEVAQRGKVRVYIRETETEKTEMWPESSHSPVVLESSWESSPSTKELEPHQIPNQATLCFWLPPELWPRQLLFISVILRRANEGSDYNPKAKDACLGFWPKGTVRRQMYSVLNHWVLVSLVIQ